LSFHYIINMKKNTYLSLVNLKIIKKLYKKTSLLLKKPIQSFFNEEIKILLYLLYCSNIDRFLATIIFQVQIHFVNCNVKFLR
jgi:hypothetical protein